MLFYDNLKTIIFNRHKLFESDELYIISGYVGPHPVKELKDLPINSTLIYGMYGEQGIREPLHNTLIEIQSQSSNTNILYSKIPIHSKCYIWRYKGEVKHALIGSANFSTNGLTTPYKEVLAETTIDTFKPLNDYIKYVEKHTILCSKATFNENKANKQTSFKFILDKQHNFLSYGDICTTPLYIVKNGLKEIPTSSGLNWGIAKLNGSHVNIDDAYIKISSDMINKYPILFPAKQTFPTQNVVRQGHRHNDNIEIIWDDGTNMIGLLEGSINKDIDGINMLFPKQISSSPKKSILGKYIRKRLGLDSGTIITMEHLKNYGRDTIDISLLGEGVYYFDFSVPNK